MTDVIHKLAATLEQKREEITAWMAKKRAEVPIPIYGSVDIRDSGWKVAVVDANHFPAGFNNISETDEPYLAELMKEHIDRLSPVSYTHLTLPTRRFV